MPAGVHRSSPRLFLTTSINFIIKRELDIGESTQHFLLSEPDAIGTAALGMNSESLSYVIQTLHFACALAEDSKIPGLHALVKGALKVAEMAKVC